MSYGSVLHRRLLKLERSQRPSLPSKLDEIQSVAVASMPHTDFVLLEAYKKLEFAGRVEQATPEQLLALDRFDEAYENALIAAGPRFSIAEMDQIFGVE